MFFLFFPNFISAWIQNEAAAKLFEMLYSQYGEITYFVLFCRGLRRPCTRRRVRPGAMWRWRVSVSGWVRQAVFRRNFRFVLPHIKAGGTLRYDETNLSPDFAIIGVLPCFAYATHYTPNPSIFSQKINFIISPQREQSEPKKQCCTEVFLLPSGRLQAFT